MQRPAIRPVGAGQTDIKPGPGFEQPLDAHQTRIAIAIDQIAESNDAVTDQPPNNMNERDRGDDHHHGARPLSHLSPFNHGDAQLLPRLDIKWFPLN